VSANTTIPRNWCVAPLSDTADFRGGGTPSKSESSYWNAGTIPWVSPKDMKSFVIGGSEDRVSVKALDKLSLLPEESVLVVVRSGILSHTLPVAVTVVPVTINQDMRAFVPRPGINARFLAWQLVAMQQRVLDDCSKHGTTVASIEGPAFARFGINVAPRSEQHRIVEKLEELLSDLDAGVAELRAAQAKLRVYRQSLLKAAVTGELTAKWRERKDVADVAQCKTGVALLARIIVERRQRSTGLKRERVSADACRQSEIGERVDAESRQATLAGTASMPNGWGQARVDQIASLASGNTPKDAVALASDFGAIPWFKVGDMNHPENDDLMTVSRTRFAAQVAADLGMRLMPIGTIIFPKRGGAIATNKKRRLGVAGCVDLNVMGLLAEGCLQEWVWWWFQGVDLASLSDGSNVPQINNPDIANLAIPLPPLDEQAEIIAVLSSLLEQAGQQESAMSLALRQSEAQRKNILQAAFSGHLVPQDPNDEPASVLLERIRASRANNKASAPTRRTRKAKEPA
jgi:type I restriction enzyme, S subunit